MVVGWFVSACPCTKALRATQELAKALKVNTSLQEARVAGGPSPVATWRCAEKLLRDINSELRYFTILYGLPYHAILYYIIPCYTILIMERPLSPQQLRPCCGSEDPGNRFAKRSANTVLQYTTGPLPFTYVNLIRQRDVLRDAVRRRRGLSCSSCARPQTSR